LRVNRNVRLKFSVGGRMEHISNGWIIIKKTYGFIVF